MKEFKKRNYLTIAIEGGFFMGGIQFLSMESVMPAMIHDLGGPAWAVSIAPVLFFAGFCWPQIFSAIWVERLRQMKPMTVAFGVIQRIPYLLTGLFLLFMGANHPKAAVLLAFITPFVMSSLGGIIGPAYFELISRIIPFNRTASMWGLRNALMAVFGIGAGIIIKLVLEARPGASGYGILYLIAFMMMTVSIVLLSSVKETNIPDEPKQDPLTLKEGFRSFRRVYLENSSLGRFIFSRILFMQVFIIIPFLSVRAIERTGSESSLVGELVAMQMIGFISGNLITGYFGDKAGPRMPMIMGRALLLFGFLFAPMATVSWHFQAIFLLLGFGMSSSQVGEVSMMLDFAPSVRRKFFFGIMNLLVLPGLVSASFISALLQYVPGGFLFAGAASTIGIGLSLVYLLKLEDPRLRRMKDNPV